MNNERYKIEDIRNHPWYSLVEHTGISKGIVVGIDIIPIDPSIITRLKEFDIDEELAKKYLEANRHNDIVTTYYLLLKKYQREKKSSSTSAIKNILVANKQVNSLTKKSEVENIDSAGIKDIRKVSLLKHYNVNA